MGKYYGIAVSDYDKNKLEHYGIKGQRWGIRRWQNEDGTLTPEGKERYTYTTGLPGVRRMSLVGRMKFGNKYANEFNARSKKEAGFDTKEKEKQWEEDERKKFDEMTEKEHQLRDLSKRMDSFDKASTDEKFKIIDDVIKKNVEVSREGGHDNRKISDGLMDWYWENYSKAGEARLKDYENLPAGPERDKKLTQLLGDSYEHGQDSEYVNALIDKMQATSGDYLSRNFKNESARQAAEAFDSASNDSSEITKRYYQQDQKQGKYPKDPYSSGFLHEDQLAKDHPEVKQAIEKRHSAWQKYCEQVLKDMGMPVNEKTIEYIEAVIIWN